MRTVVVADALILRVALVSLMVAGTACAPRQSGAIDPRHVSDRCDGIWTIQVTNYAGQEDLRVTQDRILGIVPAGTTRTFTITHREYMDPPERFPTVTVWRTRGESWSSRPGSAPPRTFAVVVRCVEDGLGLSVSF